MAPEQIDVSHKYNSDLLLQKVDLDNARAAYPNVFYVLDNSKLRATFCTFDIPANRAKRHSRWTGSLAVFLGVVSLCGAAIAPVLEGGIVKIVTFGSGVCGAISIFIGLIGVLYASRKRNWLHGRLMTERIRQFHFQTMIRRWPAILDSLDSKHAQHAYFEERDAWFSAFLARFESSLGSEFQDVTDEDKEAHNNVWLHPPPTRQLDATATAKLDELFEAYKHLRLIHQLQYTNQKLSSSWSGLATSVRLQAIIFAWVALACILFVFCVHVVSAIATPLASTKTFAWMSSFAALFEGHNAHVAVLWVAIAVLAIRALEEGYQPARELERYESYRQSLRSILTRFDEAHSGQEKIALMEEMERLAFVEMRSFLKINQDARFVM